MSDLLNAFRVERKMLFFLKKKQKNIESIFDVHDLHNPSPTKRDL
jgi:hypothetical protein